MQSLKDLIVQRYKNTPILASAKRAMLIKEFNLILADIFGEQIFNKISSPSLKNKIISLSCNSSVLMQEIVFHKQEIIDRLNEKFGSTTVEDIKFY